MDWGEERAGTTTRRREFENKPVALSSLCSVVLVSRVVQSGLGLGCIYDSPNHETCHYTSSRRCQMPIVDPCCTFGSRIFLCGLLFRRMMCTNRNKLECHPSTHNIKTGRRRHRSSFTTVLVLY